MSDSTPGATYATTPDLCVGRGGASGGHCCYLNVSVVVPHIYV